MPTEDQIDSLIRKILITRPNITLQGLAYSLKKDYKVQLNLEDMTNLWRRYKGHYGNPATHDVNTGAPL